MVKLFKSDETTANAVQILRGETLQKHFSNVPALLLCVEGEAIFEDENGVSASLKPGDYVDIVPMVKHWVKGVETSQLILIKLIINRRQIGHLFPENPGEK